MSNEEKQVPDTLGLDKAARNALKRERNEPLVTTTAPTLEPPFPYTMIPLDHTFFD